MLEVLRKSASHTAKKLKKALIHFWLMAKQSFRAEKNNVFPLPVLCCVIRACFTAALFFEFLAGEAEGLFQTIIKNGLAEFLNE